MDRRGDGAGDARHAHRRAARVHSRHLDRHPHASRPAKRSSPSRATTATATISCRRRSRPAPASRSSPPTSATAFPQDAPLLVVPDVLDGLRDLARAARARSPAKIVGVTGSVGKTGTKEALRLTLSRDGETHASVASYNNHWGVPLSLARCSRERALRGVRDRHEPCRRDRAAHPPGAAARGDRHHDRAGAPRILRLARRHRRRQGRDLPRPRAGRRRGHQPRQSAICAAGGSRQARRGRAHRLVRRARQGRGAAHQVLAASRPLDRAGPHPGHRCHLQARRARPAPGAQLAGGAGGGGALRRRSRAGGAGARPVAAGGGARRPRHARAAGRRGAADRRELQCQSGLDAGGARFARAIGRGAARPASGGARRHAGAGRRRRRAPSRAGRAGGRARHRSRLLLWSPDAQPVGRPSLRAAGAAMPRLRPPSNRKCLPPSSRATP